MRFIVLSVLVSLFSSVITLEKDYSLFDYSGLSDEQVFRLNTARRSFEAWCNTYIAAFNPVHHPRTLQSINYNITSREIEHCVHTLKHAQTSDYYSSDFREYLCAANGMEMAVLLNLMQDPRAQITKSQIHRVWRLGNKDISRMMALCRKHPENASKITENFKRALRTKFIKRFTK